MESMSSHHCAEMPANNPTKISKKYSLQTNY